MMKAALVSRPWEPLRLIARAGCIFWVIFLFLTTFAFAQTSLKVEVDKKKIAADELLTYKLTLTTSEKQLPEVSLPDFSGFNIISQVQSSRVSLTKGKMHSTSVYTFVLSPQKEGKFSIGPSQIKLKNKATISSESFEIEVLPASLPSPPAADTEKPQYTL